MNFARRCRIGWLCFLLPLIFLFTNGCSTEQSGVVANKDLEKYRKVYLLQPKQDERDFAAGILSRLKRAGFDTIEVNAEELKKIVADKKATEPTLICQFGYVSTWNYDRTWSSFISIDIEFSDLEKDEVLFKVSHLNYNFEYSRLPENTELNRLFTKIRDSFFPGQPNPFRDNLKGPYGPSYRKFPTDI